MASGLLKPSHRSAVSGTLVTPRMGSTTQVTSKCDPNMRGTVTASTRSGLGIPVTTMISPPAGPE